MFNVTASLQETGYFTIDVFYWALNEELRIAAYESQLCFFSHNFDQNTFFSSCNIILTTQVALPSPWAPLVW